LPVVIPDLVSERSERRVSGIQASDSMKPKPMQTVGVRTIGEFSQVGDV
jgi:hypothetical protein